MEPNYFPHPDYLIKYLNKKSEWKKKKKKISSVYPVYLS